MPPFVIAALSVVGAVVAVKLIAREARRINAELHPQQPAPVRNDETRTLVRDPATGVYRPPDRG